MQPGSPEISLTICTYNRCNYLRDTLRSVRSQEQLKQIELLIIDNNSTDDTAAVAKDFIHSVSDFEARYFFEPNKGLSFARNRGLAEAKAPVIAYIDDDVELSPNYLKELLHFFRENPQAMGAGGKVLPKYENGIEPHWMNKYLNGFVGRVDHGNQVKLFEPPMKYPAGCNMIYKKSLLLEAGGFNNKLTFRSDDKYIFQQVKKLTKEIYYVPDAWLYHIVDSKRLEFSNFKKLFLKTGNEEKKRVANESGFWGRMKKLIEFIFKLAASVIILLVFTLKGHYSKGKYTLLSQWYTLVGFLKKDVTVR